MSRITMDEWRAELDLLSESRGDEGQTTKELVRELKVSARRMREILAEGVASGRYLAGIGRREDSVGRMQRVAVYRLAKREKS